MKSNFSRIGFGYRSPLNWIPLVVLVFSVIVTFQFRAAQAIGGKLVEQTAFRLSFDRGPGDTTETTVIEKNGGTIVSDGLRGKALRLAVGEDWVLDGGRLIGGREGTVMFWLRPRWDSTAGKSHTFLSLMWRDGRSGYFSLTQGWWEPQGARYTYFIANNQDYAHTSKEVWFEEGKWVHVACSWRSGPEGFVRLYVNGLLASEDRRGPVDGGVLPLRLTLGSDRGSPMSANRWADSDFDEISFFHKALSVSDILDEYELLQPYRASIPRDSTGHFVEMRAIFDEGTGWATEEGARRTIERIRRAGFNVYVPCVWHGAGARFPSMCGIIEGNRNFGTRDPLERLITIAHEQGIKVHPWFTVALRQRDMLAEFHLPGTPPESFDLHRPGYRKFIVNLISEVAKKYPVDGINLDYIRTMGVCRCDKCITEYRNKYGRELTVDAVRTDPNGVLKVAALQEWQDDAVEGIVRDVAIAVRALRPSAVLSVDGHPSPFDSAEGRAEVRWVNRGFVDLIFDMAYGDAPDVETPHFMRRQLNDPNRLVTLVSNYRQSGSKLISKDPSWLSRVITYIRGCWGNGIGVYLYSMLSDDQIDELAQGPFANRAYPNTE